MTSTGKQMVGNLVDHLVLATDDPHPEAEATPASGFEGRKDASKSQASARLVLNDKRNTNVQPTNGEKRKAPPGDQSNSTQISVVVRRKKRTTSAPMAVTAVIEHGNEENNEHEKTQTEEDTSQSENDPSLKNPMEYEEDGSKGAESTTNETEEESSDETEEEVSDEEKWQTFVATVDHEDCSLLDVYLQAKDTRLAHQVKFQKALEACIDSLKACGKGMIEETSRAACAKRSMKMKVFEDDITNTLVSNDTRRQSCLDQMYETDRKWKNEYENLTGRLLTGADLSKASDEDSGTKDITNASGAPESTENIANDKNEDSSSTEDSLPQKEGNQDEEPDWSKICEYEPAQKSVSDFLAAKNGFGCATANVDESQNQVERSVTLEVLELIESIQVTIAAMENRIFDLEFDIQSHTTSNYDRRANQKEQIKISAQQAQAKFSSLLGSLVQSMR